MTAIQAVFANFQQKLSSQFIRNLSWLGITEVITRIFRLGVTVILARFLTQQDYGLAAIIAMVGEFRQVCLGVGISVKLVQAEPESLESLCDSAYWLNWTSFVVIFIIECLLAFPISWFYHNSQLVLPICVAATPYLIMPISAIQGTLLRRENNFKIIAIHDIICNSGSYFISAIFAVLGMGIWSIVLPWVLMAPIGVFIYYKKHPWRPRTGFTTKYWKEIFRFGKNIVGANLLQVLRNNLDYLIVGRFLGITELGIYFFGFNAGLGISMSVINALNSAFFPHLCAVLPDSIKFKKRYFSSLKSIGLIIIPLVLLQSSLAPLYVPFVFGQKWAVAIPILILICLSAIPRPFADAASQLLMAIGKPDLDLRWNILFTVVFAGTLLVGVHWQAIGVAISVLVVHVICLPLFTFWTTRYVFHKSGSVLLS